MAASVASPETPELSSWSRLALSEQDPRIWRPALMELARCGTPEAYEAIALAARDDRDPTKASDAVGVLARYPRRLAVEMLKQMVRSPEPHLTRLRGLQGLVLMWRWTSVASIDAESQEILGEVKTFLLSEGLGIAAAVAGESPLAGFRYEAKRVQQEVEFMVR